MVIISSGMETEDATRVKMRGCNKEVDRWGEGEERRGGGGGWVEGSGHLELLESQLGDQPGIEESLD